MMDRLVTVFWTLTLTMCAAAAGDYPTLKLDNRVIQLSIYLPDAGKGYYRGTRFDWSGIIERVDFQGHRFYAPLHQQHDPHVHDAVSGPAEEFAMFHPMGYAEAKPGESFVKIGVGLLAKGGEDEYTFDGSYRLIRAGQWTVDSQPEQVTFRQKLNGERGWAYDYAKTIRLIRDSAEFVIEHRLENTGTKTIDIDHYNHNFTLIDDVPYGPDYRVEFPFTTDKPVAINDLAWVRGNTIEVDKPLQENSLWIQVFEGEDPGNYNTALVSNRKTGASVEFRGDAPITRMVFWAVERAACPEPFIRIDLAPGEVKTWSSFYRFMVDEDG